MDNKKERFTPPAVGGSALLAVFAVLCLTVFALLSLSTVKADGRVAQASRDAVTEYYAADTRAEEIFARIRNGEAVDDEDLAISSSIYEYDDHIALALSYTVPISETQELQVELTEREGEWTVTRWQACPIGGEEFDDFLDLWDGDGTTF